MPETQQNLYIRKLNGLGQKITVKGNTTVNELKKIIFDTVSNHDSNNFQLIFKGNDITKTSLKTINQLQIPSNGILHLVSLDQKMPLQLNSQNHQNMENIQLKVVFNESEYNFTANVNSKIIDLKKQIATKLNLIYQSLVLSHFGVQMLNDKQIKDFTLNNGSMISLLFDIKKPQKKKLQTRLVSSVTFSDENNQPNSPKYQYEQNNLPKLEKLSTSSKSIDTQIQQNAQNPQRNMYKSDINNSFNSSGNSKAAMMFKNALHQKIDQTESVVSGSFQDQSLMDTDPSCVQIMVKNEQDTKDFTLDCNKNHQIKDLKLKLMEIEGVKEHSKLQISLEEDLFQSIDLSKSGCITLGQIVKKMGKDRVMFIYRVV